MQNILHRAAQTRSPCRCGSCISTGVAIARRVTTSASRRLLKPTPSSTFVYSSIFAAAALTDAKVKQDRRDQWDRAIEAARNGSEAYDGTPDDRFVSCQGDFLIEGLYKDPESRRRSPIAEQVLGACRFGTLVVPAEDLRHATQPLAGDRIRFNGHIEDIGEEASREVSSHCNATADQDAALKDAGTETRLVHASENDLKDGLAAESGNTGLEQSGNDEVKTTVAAVTVGTEQEHNIGGSVDASLREPSTSGTHAIEGFSRLEGQASVTIAREDDFCRYEGLTDTALTVPSGTHALLRDYLAIEDNNHRHKFLKLNALLGPKTRNSTVAPQYVHKRGYFRQLKALTRAWSEKKLKTNELMTAILVTKLLELVYHNCSSEQKMKMLSELHCTDRLLLLTCLNFTQLGTLVAGLKNLRQRLYDISGDRAFEIEEQFEPFAAWIPSFRQDQREWFKERQTLNKGLLAICLEHESDAHAEPFDQAARDFYLILKICHNLLGSTAPPNLRTYNILLTELGQRQGVFALAAKEAIRSFLQSHTRPNEITYIAILDHYIQSNDAEGFTSFVRRMRGEGKGVVLARPDIQVRDGATRLIQRSNGKVVQLPHPHPDIFRTMMEGCIKFHGVGAALQLSRAMSLEGWALDMLGLRLFFDEFRRIGDWDLALSGWGMMKKLSDKAVRENRGGKLDYDMFAEMLAFCEHCGRDSGFIYEDAVRHGLNAGLLRDYRKQRLQNDGVCSDAVSTYAQSASETSIHGVYRPQLARPSFHRTEVKATEADTYRPVKAPQTAFVRLVLEQSENERTATTPLRRYRLQKEANIKAGLEFSDMTHARLTRKYEYVSLRLDASHNSIHSLAKRLEQAAKALRRVGDAGCGREITITVGKPARMRIRRVRTATSAHDNMLTSVSPEHEDVAVAVAA